MVSTMTATTPPRQSCVCSISLPRELSDWVESESKLKNIAKSKVIQLALAHYRDTNSYSAKDTTTSV